MMPRRLFYGDTVWLTVTVVVTAILIIYNITYEARWLPETVVYTLRLLNMVFFMVAIIGFVSVLTIYREYLGGRGQMSRFVALLSCQIVIFETTFEAWMTDLEPGPRIPITTIAGMINTFAMARTWLEVDRWRKIHE